MGTMKEMEMIKQRKRKQLFRKKVMKMSTTT